MTLPEDPRPTEHIHPAHAELDRQPTAEVLRALILDQGAAVEAALKAAEPLARAADLASERLRRGGRLIYLGAGTSGRLGTLDATELGPTFSWPTERALSLIAGGMAALTSAVEGAEDDARAGAADLLALHPTALDVVIGVAASGTTPYTLAALRVARAAGALTVGIANNPQAPLLQQAEVGVLLDTGPEVISGSTRLKAGTAQKIALNALSSAIMVRLGKVYGNLMVDLRASNAKLEARALRLVMAASGQPESAARAALHASGGRVKSAVVMLRLGVGFPDAQARLEAAGGNARQALGE